MKKTLLALFLCLSPVAFADLTQDQKVSDFMQLAGLYARNYGPYELKRDVFGFDLYKVSSWLTQVKASKTDLDFYDICTRYVASLQDSHDEFTINSDYEAILPLRVDIYDGKVLIDGISRSRLPAARFPFRVGDELVSVDGKPMAAWITDLSPYAFNGSSNAVSRARLAASLTIDRLQFAWPTAPSGIGTNATIVVSRQPDGTMESYDIPWMVFGTELKNEGPIPSLQSSALRQTLRQTTRPAPSDRSSIPLVAKGDPDSDADSNPWGLFTGERTQAEPDPVPTYMDALRKLTESKPIKAGSLFPFGILFPAFNPPAGFKLRLGSRATDVFLSGTFMANGKNVGFIRIPDMSPPSTSAALNQFLGEIQYFQQNTDGLVIDVMGNGGGSGCYTQTLVSLLMPQTFHGLSFQLRATQAWVSDFSSSLENAKALGAPQYVIDLYTAYLKEVQQAFSENRGMTGPLPACGSSLDAAPARDRGGNSLAYTKPILALTDNFTLSAGEIFVMMLQDENRATLFGTRTDGGGGSVVSFNAGAFSEGSTRITLDVINRKAPVATPGYPSLPFYDGVGIYPDILADFQTVANLNTKGQPFVDSVVGAITDLINKANPPKDQGQQ